MTGTSLEVADSGTLSISSQRAVFLGGLKTMEFPYSRIVGVDVYGDAIRIHASNRQTAPLFSVGLPEYVAATLNAAIQRFLDSST